MSKTQTIASDKDIITEQDLRDAIDGLFLEKMQEFARRGKDAKIPEHIVKMYQLRLSLTFGEIDQSLSFDTLTGYELHIQPFTEEDLENINAARESTESGDSE